MTSTALRKTVAGKDAPAVEVATDENLRRHEAEAEWRDLDGQINSTRGKHAPLRNAGSSSAQVLVQLDISYGYGRAVGSVERGIGCAA